MIADPLRELAEANSRPNAVDAAWEIRPEERAFLERVGGEALLQALVALLPDAGLERTRYLCWLVLPRLPDQVLPRVAEATGSVSDPDARLLAVHQLVGRSLSLGAAPSWLVAAASVALSEAAAKASDNLAPTVEVLRKVVAEPARFGYQSGLVSGARLFNAGRYFEAHEAWEDVWRPMRGEERDFFQALINLAVAMNKAREGNANGVVRLLDRTLRLLAPYGSAGHRGVDLGQLTGRLGRLKEQAVQWREGRRGALDPGEIPRLPE